MDAARTPGATGRSLWQVIARGAALCVAVLTLAGVAPAPPSPAHAAIFPSRDEILRLHMLLNLVGEEYRESVVGEEGLRDREYVEARAFLEETRERWTALRADTGGDPEGTRRFSAVSRLLLERGTPEGVRSAIEELQAHIAGLTGVAPDIFPPETPSVELGRRLFLENCARCHGEKADGRGPDAGSLDPPPSDFTAATFMAEQTPFDFFHVVSAGRLGAGMPAWGDVLSVQQRWDVVAYLWSVRGQGHDGARVYESNCGGCHGVGGAGGGSDLGDPRTLARLSDAELAGLIRDGVPGSSMRAADGLSVADVEGAVAGLRALATREGRPQDAAGAFARAHSLLGETVALAGGGDPRAADRALDAYLAYEMVEKRVALVAAGLSRRLEGEFAELRALAKRQADIEEIGSVASRVTDDLTAAELSLRAGGAGASIFVQSLTIILREGFEALLIIAALAAYLTRIGRPDLRWQIYAGAAGGVLASLVTAWIFVSLVPGGARSQEAFEGATMLLAAAILFSVSYWLISRAEADRWQRYIRGRVTAALARGSMLALAGTAFLAVYREGVETVLFYQALLGAAGGQPGHVVAGMAAGVLLLGGLYFGSTALGLRVPMGAFFLGTGLVLYAMAFSFAGHGIRELQHSGLISMTPWGGWPGVEWLGMSSSLEVALVQGGLLVAALVAALVLLRRRTRATAAASTAAGAAGAGEVTSGG